MKYNKGKLKSDFSCFILIYIYIYIKREREREREREIFQCDGIRDWMVKGDELACRRYIYKS